MPFRKEKKKGKKKRKGKGLVFKMCHPMSRESVSLLHSRGSREDHPAVRNAQRQVLLWAFETHSLSALHLHRKQENVWSRSTSCSASAQMKALVSSSWHHGDAAPCDCAEGGDKEPIGRPDAESEPLLHQHFLTRFHSHNYLMKRSQTYVGFKKKKKKEEEDCEWQHWMWLALIFS